MSKRFALLTVFVFSVLSLSSQGFLDADNPNSFLLDNISFQLNPKIVLSNYPEQGSTDQQIIFINTFSQNDTTFISYEFTDCRLVLKVSEYPHINSSLIFSYELSGRQEVKLKDFYLEFFTDNISDVFHGPEAVFAEDSSQNRPTVPFKDRVVMYKLNDQKLFITGSKFPGTSNIEVIKNNRIYIYDSDFHKAFWRKENIWLDWKKISTVRNAKGSFIVSTESPDYPLFNYFPAGKRAAFTLSSDADYETVNRLRAVFFGSNITYHPDYGTKGLAANDLRVTNSIFGYHWERDAEVHQEILAAGNRIAYHTYSSRKDERVDLLNNLQNEVSDMSINYWIDHNAGANPEDLAVNGAVRGSENYILDILENNAFKYAWITDSKNYKRNAFDEYFELPHHCEAMTGDYKLYILGRRSGINWEWIPGSYDLGFKPNVTDSVITDLIEHRGLMHMYTHLCMPNTGGTMGFLNYIGSENRYEVKSDVEACFRMLNHHQTFSGLWVAPAEEIYDRMFLVDSLEITFVRNHADQTILDIHNPTQSNLSDIEISFLDETVVLDFSPGSTQTISFMKPQVIDSEDQNLDEETHQVDISDDENFNDTELKITTNIINSYLVIKVMMSKKDLSSYVSIYNLKGQRVMSEVLSSGTGIVKIPVSDFSTGVYLIRCKSGSNSKTIKTLILK